MVKKKGSATSLKAIKESNRLDKRLLVRMNETDVSRLKAIAAVWECKDAAVFRRMLRETFTRIGLGKTPEIVEQ